ncbi:MAG: hypothetical protein KGN79_00315 [Acidobacteriota bacterium]|nr:hypothetical protein [Acidobacteriota bacterium]
MTEQQKNEPPAAGQPTLMQRIFTRNFMNIALLILMPMLFAPFLNLQRLLVIDPDVWWHLANARLLFSTHHFIWTDPYSFTVHGQQWVNPEWLSEIPLWICYKAFNLQGLYLAAWIGIAANVLFVYWRGLRMSRHGGAAFYAAGIAGLMMTVNCSPRTIQYAYLALSAELAILETPEPKRQKLLWLLPVLFCVWINLHGTWIIGLALFAIYIVCGLFSFNQGVFEQTAFSPAQRKQLITVLVLCVGALFINPYGWHLVWNPFDMMFNQTANIGNVAEWTPLEVMSLEGIAVLGGIGIMVLAACLRARKWRVYELVFVLFAWFSAFDHHRFTYLAGVIVTPLIAVDFARAFLSEPDNKTIPAMNALLAAAAAVAMFFLFPSQKALREGVDTWFPPRLIASIQPTWRTLAWDDLGGMMTFMGKPDFYDTRVDIFEHNGILQDYLKVIQVDNAFQLLDKYKIDHVLVMKKMAISYVLSRSTGWRLTGTEGKEDQTFVMFERDPSYRSNQDPTKIISSGEDNSH